MKITKLSVLLAVTLSFGTFEAQTTESKNTDQSVNNIGEVVISVEGNKQSEEAVLRDIKKAQIQKQALGMEEISRKGISNLEEGLTKITGINTVEGKGLFVRGLEERYNYLLINHLGSPSNNPFQKIIALNQFPTDVVGKLNVYKTFNADLYADFAGATFDVETLHFARPFTKVEFGIGVNTESTFRKHFKISEGAHSMKGYLGLNSEDRRIPEIVRNSTPAYYDFTPKESIHAFKDSWNVADVTTLPDTNFSFTIADRKKFKNQRQLAYLFSLNHGTSFQYREGAKNQFLAIQPNVVLNNELQRKKYVYELETAALLGLGYKSRKTEVNFNAIFLQNSANIIQDFIGFKNQEVNNKRFFRVNQQDISRFLDLQLTAQHKINDRQEIKAGISYVMNDYAQPDRKIFDGDILEDSNYVRTSYGANNLIRQYLDVNGKFYGSAFAEYAIQFGEQLENNTYPWKLSVGYNGFADIRETSYRFIYAVADDYTLREVTINKDRPQPVFDQSVRQGAFHYKEGSNENTYKNTLRQFVNAGYVSLNYKPSKKWNILLGGRVENSWNKSIYKKQSDAEEIHEVRTKYYILPSLSVKYQAGRHTNIRLALSKTITRPILIEYMPIEYINPDNENLYGNPNLKNSENYNIDLKWEFFPSRDEMFAVNLFGKRIVDAIERSYTASGNSNGQAITFYNAKHADIAGIELEGILSLKRLTESLSGFYLGFNATLMYTNVERSEEELVQEKPNGFTGALKDRWLQGATPYTINADLRYEFKNKKNQKQSISLVYNLTGKKIYSVGTAGADHIYEMPFNHLDLVYNAKLNKHWGVKLAVSNILNQMYELKLGNESYYQNIAPTDIHTNYKLGTTFSLSVGYTF